MRLTLFLVLLSWCTAHGYKILSINPIPSRSHHHLAKGIVQALLDAGHEVTWATPYPELIKPTKNLKVVDMTPIQEAGKILDDIGRTFTPGISFIKELSRNLTEVSLQSELKELLVKESYDAVVSEWFFSDTESAYAAILQVPWILLSSISAHVNIEELIDEARSVTVIPHILNSGAIPMTIWQRALNLGLYAVLSVADWFQHSASEEFYAAKFGPIAKARGVPLPPLVDALHNISIVLVNSHPIFAPARSLPPNVVDIAGYHIDEEIPPLPKDLKDLIDASKCVVYFSLGSVVKSSGLPEETRSALLDILGRVPCLVLWKFEAELQGAPKNVHVKKWMPQASILNHPKLKLFITHGGLLSVLEALHAGIPLLTIPVFGDQPSNAERAVSTGFARMVNFKRMTDELEKEIGEMMRNDSYYQKAQSLSKLFRNRPVAPRKLLTHYIELAVESKGAYHLRSPSLLYKWYERWMLDVLLILSVIFYLIYLAFKVAFRTLKQKLCKNCEPKRKLKTR